MCNPLSPSPSGSSAHGAVVVLAPHVGLVWRNPHHIASCADRRRQCQDYFPLFPLVNSSFGNNENSAKARKCAWAVRSHYNRVSLYFDQWVLAFLLPKSGTLALNHSSCSPCLQIKSLMLYKLPIIIMSNLLCAGGPYNAMFFLFRIPVATLAYLIPETCEAIYNALKDRYLKVRKKQKFKNKLSFNIFNFNDQFFIFAVFLYHPHPHSSLFTF